MNANETKKNYTHLDKQINRFIYLYFRFVCPFSRDFLLLVIFIYLSNFCSFRENVWLKLKDFTKSIL